MWRRILPVLLLFGLLAGSGGAAASSPNAGSAAPAASCPVQYHPENLTVPADCALPSGGSINYPCGIDFSKASINWCSAPIPDVNPVDWLSWFACQFASAVVGLVSGLFNLVTSGLTTLTNAFLDVVTAIEDAILGVFQAVDTAFVSVADLAGPLAPVVLVLLVFVVVVGGILLSYFVIVLLFAGGKTLFNLL